MKRILHFPVSCSRVSKLFRTHFPGLSVFLIGAIIGSCLPGSALIAQNYFKRLEASDNFFRQRIAHFSNGDLLIGDSSIEAVRTGMGGEIYLTRMDACGQVIWTRAYRREEEYLELKDIKINEADEIFAYGSAYLGLDELIFLLKLDKGGNSKQFKLYQPETVDHFSYNIDLKDGKLMAYGLILDFGTKKFGFVAIFDEALNFRWGKKFSPFSSSGEARITADNGFICRSGQYLFKLDPDGELEWATELAPNIHNSPVAGPVEVADGYVLQATGDGLAFFYKVNRAGDLIWKSEQFPAKSFPADLKLETDGRISAVYSATENSEQQLYRLLLDHNGQIIQQEQLNTELSIKPGRVFQSAPENGPVVLSVNPDPAVPQQVDAAGFLIQYMPGEISEEDCFEWVVRRTVQSNEAAMNFSRLDTIVQATQMNFLNNTNIAPAPFDQPLINACSDGPDLELIGIDTILACGEDWTVSLPSMDFSWEDGVDENPRILAAPGSYTAHNEDCGAQVVYEFHLDKPDCQCQVYLPTAFSPNQDGINDHLELFTDCELSHMQLTVFSRWGEKVFESQTPGNFWDGYYRGKTAPNGLYLVKIEYEWLNSEGQIQSGAILENISLIR